MNVRRAIIVVGLAALAASAVATETSVPFILADQVHLQRITGFGVTVAVIDSGVDYGEPGLAGASPGSSYSRLRERLRSWSDLTFHEDGALFT